MSQNTVRAGEYVLGVLSPDERVAVERDAAADPDLAAEIAFWNERFTPLIDNVEAEPRRTCSTASRRIRVQSAPVQTGAVLQAGRHRDGARAETLADAHRRRRAQDLWRAEGRVTIDPWPAGCAPARPRPR